MLTSKPHQVFSLVSLLSLFFLQTISYPAQSLPSSTNNSETQQSIQGKAQELLLKAL
jgi:hypothetical protein